MEPVPETERMEAFRSSPVPSLRRTSSSRSTRPRLDIDTTPGTALSTSTPQKPANYRRSTDPLVYQTSPSASSPVLGSPTTSSSTWGSVPNYSTPLPYRPRTASPLSAAGRHSRSRSAASLLPPPMSRTQSMPGFASSGHVLLSPRGGAFGRPESPSGGPPGSPSRSASGGHRTPRKPLDEAFPPLSPIRSSVLDPEHHRPRHDGSSSPILGVSTNNTGRLRRPSSPLRSSASLPVPPAVIPALPPAISSPTTRPYDYSTSTTPSLLSCSAGSASGSISGGGGSSSLSSIPSTPTSARSRSPSISSLETIPDSPDAEERALEAERIAQLKADADAEAEDSDGKSRSSSVDVPSRGRTMTFGSKDKRKRWSVCGAERRGDIDLETIWED